MARTKQTSKKVSWARRSPTTHAEETEDEEEGAIPPEGQAAGYIDDESDSPIDIMNSPATRDRKHRQEFVDTLRAHDIDPSSVRGNVALKVVAAPDAEERRQTAAMTSSITRELGKGEMPMDDVDALNQGYEDERIASAQPNSSPANNKPKCPEGSEAVLVKGGWRKVKNQPPAPSATGSERVSSLPLASPTTGFKMPAKRPVKAARAHPAPPYVPPPAIGPEQSNPQFQQRKRPRSQVAQNVGSGPFVDFEPWPDDEGNPGWRRIQDRDGAISPGWLQIQRDERDLQSRNQLAARLEAVYNDIMQTPAGAASSRRGSVLGSNAGVYDPERDFDPLVDVPEDVLQHTRNRANLQYLFGSDVSTSASDSSQNAPVSLYPPRGRLPPYTPHGTLWSSAYSPIGSTPSPQYNPRYKPGEATGSPGLSPLYNPERSDETSSSTDDIIDMFRRVYAAPLEPDSESEYSLESEPSSKTRGSKRSHFSTPKRPSASSSSTRSAAREPRSVSWSRSFPSMSSLESFSMTPPPADSPASMHVSPGSIRRGTPTPPSTPGTPSFESSADDVNVTPLPPGMSPATIARTTDRRADDVARALMAYQRANAKMKQIRRYPE